MIAGLVLAGGGSRRMAGRDKGFLDLDGEVLVARAVARLRPQVAMLAISANHEPERFSRFRVPVLADAVAAGEGPLAGILAGLDWAALSPGPTHLVTVAVDTPFFPPDLAARLHAVADRDAVVTARSSGRPHPVFSLWPLGLRSNLESFLTTGDDRSVRGFMAGERVTTVDFPFAKDGTDPFFNINSPDKLEMARRVIAQAGRIA